MQTIPSFLIASGNLWFHELFAYLFSAAFKSLVRQSQGRLALMNP